MVSGFGAANARCLLVLTERGFVFHLVAEPVLVVDSFDGWDLVLLGTTGV